MNIAAVCGSFHKGEIERMLDFAKNEASIRGAIISQIIWVPGINGSTTGFRKNLGR